jgi:beta-galactosidase/beta-glucuronidase
MMKKSGLLAFALSSLSLLSVVCLGQSAVARAKYNFNSDWKVLAGDPQGADQPGFDDSLWKRVTTPYAWNEDSAFRVSIHDLPTGVAWYRKHFRLPAGSAGQKIFIEFEGIRQAGEVYLNGKFIGRHEDGVMAFGFDISDAVKPAPDENVLAVRTDNSWDYKEKATGTLYQWNNINFYSNNGGISKNVWLHVTGKLYQTLPLYTPLGTTGVYVWASDINIPGKSARITVESEARNENSAPQTVNYQIEIKDIDGKIVSRFNGGATTLAAGETRTLTASAIVHDLHFWSWGYGYLYSVTTKLVAGHRTVDVVHTRTGFRKTEFANGMVKLNDRVIDLHGYAQRTTNEWPAVGLTVPPWMSDFSNRLMVDGNAAIVRWMHVTPWKQDIESSDRVGLIEAMPAGDAERDVTGRQWDLRVALMRDAIIYNRNNPSILFY